MEEGKELVAGLNKYLYRRVCICSAVAKYWTNCIHTYIQSLSRLEYTAEWIKFGTIAHIYSPPLLDIFDLQLRSGLGLGFQGLKNSFYLP